MDAGQRMTARSGGPGVGFEQFAAAHGAGLVKLAFVIGGDRDRAEDAAQEALSRVYQRWPRLRDPHVYARRVVVNATRDDWRRAARRDRVCERLGGLPAAAPSDPQAAVLERDALMDALAQLPHAQRAVVVLRYGLGLSEAETAHTLGIPIGTVKSRNARALVRLRELLTATAPADHASSR